jgi:probable F420-dependent oxidoreductase
VRIFEAPPVQIIPPGKLVFGIGLPGVAQSDLIISAAWEKQAGREEILQVAEAADRLGLFYVTVCDHVCIPREKARVMSTTWYDAVATLGFIAAATTRVRLLSYVYVLPYRHPLASAKAFATLDALSGGRVILGVGAGHLAEEFATLGVDFAARGKLLNEAIDLVAAALRDEYPEHDGPHWKVTGMGIGPRPVQRPRPPIWVGGSTEGALRRAALRGDGWLPQGTTRAELPRQIATVREERRRRRGDVPIEIGAASDRLYIGRPSFDLGPGSRSGSPEEIAADLRELEALGVAHVGLRFRSRSCGELLEQLDRFAREVEPLVNG